MSVESSRDTSDGTWGMALGTYKRKTHTNQMAIYSLSKNIYGLEQMLQP
jgi:hypothetical protein